MAGSSLTAQTRGGRLWTPRYVINLDQKLCIGCGRCYKTCPRDVFQLVERELNDDDDEDDTTAQVMSIADSLDCIGCTACANACPKGCLEHAAEPCE